MIFCSEIINSPSFSVSFSLDLFFFFSYICMVFSQNLFLDRTLLYVDMSFVVVIFYLYFCFPNAIAWRWFTIIEDEREKKRVFLSLFQFFVQFFQCFKFQDCFRLHFFLLLSSLNSYSFISLSLSLQIDSSTSLYR